MRKIARFLSLTAAVLLVAACAYSPQQLHVQPAITVTGEPFGNGQSVLVTASDQRQSRELGKVGGLYGATTSITIANDLEAAMVRATNGLLAAYGFVVNSPDPSATQLTVVIDEIVYQDNSADKLGKDVHMTAA